MIQIVKKSFKQKFKKLNLSIIFIIILVAGIGVVLLYSAAGGHFEPWAFKQLFRFFMGFGIMIGIAHIPLRWWFQSAYLIYFIVLILLIGVEALGFIGMGAQRWIDLYLFQLQPSEIMKLALVLVFARYFHGLNCEDRPRLYQLIIPGFAVIIPVLLVLRQPDLGTAMILLLMSIGILYISGVSIWFFVTGIGAIAASIPLLWALLHDYQKKRILIFLNPEEDALGAGYHIMQSKIALGSGGLTGKGFMRGTQSYLNFLPEKQTDFIFTMLCEEFGFLGGVTLIGLYCILTAYGIHLALTATSAFSRFVAAGVTLTFFLHFFINIAMVMGLLPVVGIPLPLVSYGGTSILTLMMGLGMLFCVAAQRQIKLPKSS